jgi:hypothetical protein
LIGIAGAAITTFFAHMFMGYRGYWLQDFRDNNIVDYYPIFWLVASLIAMVFVYLAADINWGVKAILSAGIAGGLLYFRTNDLLPKIGTRS